MQSLCIELTEAVYNVSAFVNPFSLTQGILTNHTITNHEDSFIIELQTNTKIEIYEPFTFITSNRWL